MHLGWQHIIEEQFCVPGRDGEYTKSEIYYIHVTAFNEMPTFTYRSR